MKTLLLMRHGKDDLSQKKRPLTTGGKMDVDAAAERLVEANLVPDLIVHSPILRAVETAECLRDAFARVTGKDIPLRVIPALDENTSMTPWDLLDGIDEKVGTLLAVTHKPKVMGLTKELSGNFVSPENAEAAVLEAPADNWRTFTTARLVRTI